MRLREENETLMETLVRAKVELAETQGAPPAEFFTERLSSSASLWRIFPFKVSAALSMLRRQYGGPVALSTIPRRIVQLPKFSSSVKEIVNRPVALNTILRTTVQFIDVVFKRRRD